MVGAALLGALFALALQPAASWAMDELQGLASVSVTSSSGLSGAGTTDSPLACTAASASAAGCVDTGAQTLAGAKNFSTSVQSPAAILGTVDAGTYVATGGLFHSLKTDGTLTIRSDTADGTTSGTVGALTLKCGADIASADLCLDVQDSAGNHRLTVTEAGAVAMASISNTMGRVAVNGSPNTSYAVASYGAGTNGAFHGQNSTASSDVLTIALDGVGTTGAIDADGTYTSLKASGDTIVAVSGAYSRFTFNAGAPTATDCDAAGESGRIAIDTSNNRFYFCNGAAWQYVNEDVP